MKTIHHAVALLASLVTATHYVSGQNPVDPVAAAAAAAATTADAAKTRAQGEANLLNSQSLNSTQEAYSRYLENSQSSLDIYFRNKEVNKEATRPVRLTYEQYVAMAKKYGPEGLSEEQYDRALGRLNWPDALRGPELAEEREALNRLFAARTPLDVGPGTAFYGHVHRIAESTTAKLKLKFTDLTSGEYIFATKFIAGLLKECHEPLLIGVVARRQPQTAQGVLAGQPGLPAGSPTPAPAGVVPQPAPPAVAPGP